MSSFIANSGKTTQREGVTSVIGICGESKYLAPPISQNETRRPSQRHGEISVTTSAVLKLFRKTKFSPVDSRYHQIADPGRPLLISLLISMPRPSSQYWIRKRHPSRCDVDISCELFAAALSLWMVISWPARLNEMPQSIPGQTK